MEQYRERTCRTAASASVVPLLAVVVSAFLPAVVHCNVATTPAHEIAQGELWGLTPFLLAAVLAVATLGWRIAGLLRRPPRRRWLGPYRQHAHVPEPMLAPGRGTVRFVTVLWVLGSVPLVAAAASTGRVGSVAFAVGIAALQLGAVWQVVRRLRGWTRWMGLVACSVLTACMPVGVFLVGQALNPRTPGATLYVAAWVAVALAALAAFLAPSVTGRSRSASS